MIPNMSELSIGCPYKKVVYTHVKWFTRRGEENDSDDDSDEKDMSSDNRPELSLEAAGRKAEKANAVKGDAVSRYGGVSSKEWRARDKSNRIATTVANKGKLRQTEKAQITKQMVEAERKSVGRENADNAKYKWQREDNISPKQQQYAWADELGESNMGKRIEAAAEEESALAEATKRQRMEESFLVITSDIEGGSDALHLTKKMRVHGFEYSLLKQKVMDCVHAGDAGDIRGASMAALEYLNDVPHNKLCGNRDANVVRFEELFQLLPGGELTPFYDGLPPSLTAFYECVSGIQVLWTKPYLYVRLLILIYGWHRLSRGTMNVSFNAFQHTDIANSHFGPGLSTTGWIISGLTNMVTTFQSKDIKVVGTRESVIIDLAKALLDQSLSFGVKVYVANAIYWASQLAKYVAESNALSYSRVEGDGVLGVHDFFGTFGERVGQVFNTVESRQEAGLYEPSPLVENVATWVEHANRTWRSLTEISNSLGRIRNRAPKQSTPSFADVTLAQLAAESSNGFFHGTRPPNYVHTLCVKLNERFPMHDVRHVFCGHQPRPLGRLTRSQHGLILAEVDTQYTPFCATSYVIIPSKKATSPRVDIENIKESAVTRVAEIADAVKGVSKEADKHAFGVIENCWTLGRVAFEESTWRVVSYTLPRATLHRPLSEPPGSPPNSVCIMCTHTHRLSTRMGEPLAVI